MKGLLNKYARQGLRLIEVEKNDLVDLPTIVDQVAPRPERFVLFCDDLPSTARGGYIALKVALDGSISTTSENLLIYATSNRRHLMPEYMAENLETKYVGDEIHPGETVEEKISLSERFGLWVTFYPFDQDEYLEIVEQWLKSFAVSSNEKSKEEALQGAAEARAAAGSRTTCPRLGGSPREWPRGRPARQEKRKKGDVIDVAAAVIQRPDGAFLLAQRPPGKVYAGYWEFPGGKVEHGEPPGARLSASCTKSSASISARSIRGSRGCTRIRTARCA